MIEKELNQQYDEDTIRAMYSLENNRDFRILIEGLRRRSGKMAALCSFVKDETHCRWMQGRVQELQEFLYTVANAKDKLVAKPKSNVTGV